MSSNLSVGQEVELSIDRLSYGGGRGVSRHLGLVIFIPFTAPGDTVTARILKIKKNFAEAQLVKVLKPSPHRVQAPCKVFGQCGGCQWQHIEASEQIHQKQNIIEHSLSRLCESKNIITPIIFTSKNYRYRNRIQVHKKQNLVGFHSLQSHNIIPITDCLISDSRLSDQFQTIKSKKADGRYEIGLTPEEKIFISSSSAQTHNKFAQVNTEINQHMISWVKEQASLTTPNTVFDLYCGSGNFVDSLPLTKGPNYIGVELNPKSVTQAKQLFKSHTHIQFYAQDVADYLKTTESLPENSLILVDPPRKGLHPQVILELKRLRPSHIIYISCHLETLKRDLNKLSESYQIQQIQGFDMFPQTDHIETACLLRLKD